MLAMTHTCLWWILETHRQKGWIVLRHSVFSLEGLALYFPWLISCFSQKFCPMWWRNCKVGNTRKLFTMTEELRFYTHKRKEIGYGSYLCQVSLNVSRLKWMIMWRYDPTRSTQKMEGSIAATAPIFTRFPKITNPSQMMRQYKQKEQTWSPKLR